MLSATIPICIHWLRLPRYRLWGARAAAASCPIEVGCHAAFECLGNEDVVVNDASLAPLITTQQSQHSVGLLSEGFIFLLTDEVLKKKSWSPCAYRGKSQFRPQHTAEDMLQAIELLSQAIQLQDSKHASRAKDRTLRMVSAYFSSYYSYSPFFSRFPTFCIFCQPRKTNKNIEDLWVADVARESLGSQMFGPTAGWGLEGLDRGVWSFGRFWRCHARETSSTRAPGRGKGG